VQIYFPYLGLHVKKLSKHVVNFNQGGRKTKAAYAKAPAPEGIAYAKASAPEGIAYAKAPAPEGKMYLWSQQTT
jgi:hypothetical protein